MAIVDQVGVVGHDNKQPPRVDPLLQPVDHLDRRAVEPLRIVNDHGEWHLVSDALQRGCDLRRPLGAARLIVPAERVHPQTSPGLHGGGGDLPEHWYELDHPRREIADQLKRPLRTLTSPLLVRQRVENIQEGTQR